DLVQDDAARLRSSVRRSRRGLIEATESVRPIGHASEGCLGRRAVERERMEHAHVRSEEKERARRGVERERKLRRRDRKPASRVERRARGEAIERVVRRIRSDRDAREVGRSHAVVVELDEVRCRRSGEGDLVHDDRREAVVLENETNRRGELEACDRRWRRERMERDDVLADDEAVRLSREGELAMRETSAGSLLVEPDRSVLRAIEARAETLRAVHVSDERTLKLDADERTREPARDRLVLGLVE